MTSSRLTLALIGITLILQVVGIYQQRNRAAGGTPSISDAPTDTIMPTHQLASKGFAGAQVGLIEFGDYECPYCIRHNTSVAQQLDQEFVATGKVRHIFANNPLQMHPVAPLLAAAAVCAQRLGATEGFWEMHQRIFEHQPRERTAVEAIAGEMNLPTQAFMGCLDDPTVEARISSEQDLAAQFGMTGTPAFGIGIFDGADRLVLKRIIRGSQPVEVFRDELTEVLADTGV